VKTVAIAQARMSSTRLPGKCLAEIAGRPLLWHTVTRTDAAERVDAVVVATSREPSDDPIEAFCAAESIPLFRGDLDDVLDRYRGAARHSAATLVVRVTADCPLLDPLVIDTVVAAFDPAAHDYVSNTVERTYPDGLDTEVFSVAALERAWSEATRPSEREHVTPYIWKHPERFRLHQVRQPADRSAERWTVDEPRDLEFVRAVFARFDRLDFGQEDVVALLDREPELRRLNAGIPLNEGYLRSLERDASG
jgi:spore coat polysaccharide biosynthesis protein SpsF (cytidylyltransferase family)